MMKIRNMGRAAFLLPALAILSAAAAAPVPPGTVQSYDGYKSWLVVCDNGLTCEAKGFTETDQGAEMDVQRAAGAKGAPTLTISAAHKFRLADIRIDGKPAGLTGPAWQLVGSDDETSAASDDLGAVRQFIAKLRNASKVTIGADSEIPLDGFAAAMLRLDERQGRIGGVTALFRPGPLPAAYVLPAPPLPRIPVHPIRAKLQAGEEKRLIAAIRASQKQVFVKEDCEASPNGMEAEAHALDDRQALVLIPCIMGAYQGSSIAFIAPRDGKPARRLSAPTPYLGNDPDRSDATFFTESDFDPKTGTLSMAAKGRGLADCGMSASWIWDGAAFRLSEMELQQSCGGIEPGDWPTLFRSTH